MNAVSNRTRITRRISRAKYLARVLSLKKATQIINNILFYATVQSASRPHKLSHTVLVKRKSKHSRARRFSCTCEAGSLGDSRNCRHIRATRIKLAQRRAA